MSSSQATFKSSSILCFLLTLILLAAIAPSVALGQGAYRKDNIVIGPTGQAIAGASIAVCTQPANTTIQPCSPSATLYADQNGVVYTISSISCLADVVTVATSPANNIPIGEWVTIANVINPSFDGTFQVTGQSGSGFTYPQACTNGSSSGGTVWGANPTFSDGLGNWFFYAAPGTYTVQIYANQISGQIVTPDQTLGAPGIFNSSNTWTQPQAFTAGITTNSLNDSGLTPGNCVQATTGGQLVTTSGPCGTSSGTLTATGSPVAGQGASWSGGTSLTGSPNWLYSASSGHSVIQGANGTDAFYMKRFTDTSPTGNFLHFQNNAGNTDLFKLDVSGNLSAQTATWATSDKSPAFISASANVAQSGIHRCASGDSCLVFRNNANSADIALAKNASDQPTFNGSIVPTISGAVASGHMAAFANSGQIQDGGSVPYTNWGINTSPCTTGSGAGSTCTTTVFLNATEANTSYKVSCFGIGPSGYPFMLGGSKTTTSVIVTTANGVSNESVASSWSEIDCVITR